MKRFVMTAAFAGCAAGLGLAIRLGRPAFAEVIVIGVTIAALFSVKSARRAVAAAPVAHQIVAGGLFLLFVAGHLVSLPKKTFPFVNWRMFPGMRVVPDPRFYVIEGVAPAGQRYRISPERVWPPLRDFRFTGSYQLIADQRSRLDGVHRDLLLALGRAYGRRNPGRPLSRVEVFEETIPLAGRDRHVRPKREFVYGVDLR